MDSKSGPEYVGYRSSGGDSYAACRRRDHTPSAATAAPSISCTDLLDSGRAARASPALCWRHQPPYLCCRGRCEELHLCRLFLDGFCPREDAVCRWGHAVRSAANWDALEAYQLLAVAEHELLWLTRSLLRQTAPVSSEEYRRELTLCERYAADGHCGRRHCFKVHVCPDLVAGTCRADHRCPWTHRLDDPDNVIVLLRLRCAELTEDEVLDRLASRPDDEDVVLDRPASRPDDKDVMLDRPASRSDDEDVVLDRPASRPDDKDAVLTRLVVRPDNEEEVLTRLVVRPDNEGTVNSPSSGVGSQLTMSSSASGYVADSSHCEDEEEDIEKPGAPTSDRDHVTSPSTSGPNAQSGAAPLNGEVDSQAERSSTDGASVITSLDLCLLNVHPSVCLDSSCTKLHLCRLYVAGICPFGRECITGHESCTSVHNSDVLKRHMLLGVSEADLLKGLREGYLARNPIVVEERQLALRACRPYPSGNCRQSDCSLLEDTPQTSVDRAYVEAITSVASSLDLCHQNTRPSVCEDESCQNLHLCRLFVAGVLCPNDGYCRRGHELSSEHNIGVLRRNRITALSAEDLLNNLRSGYLSRNPLSDSERRFALQVCPLYQAKNYICKCNAENCLRLHVCAGYVMGTCSGCDLSHQISSLRHTVIIRRLGLSSLRFLDIRKILQNTAKIMVGDYGPSIQKYPVPSGSAVIIDQSENHDEPADSTQKESGSSKDSATQCSAHEVIDSATQVSDSPQALAVTSDGHSSMLCDVHSSGGRCDQGDCNSFHVCRYYLANVCQRLDRSCPLGHTFQTKHNVRVMQIRGLVGCSSKEFQILLDKITLQMRTTFKNGAQKKVTTCISHNSPGGCTRADGCRQFHVCFRFLSGSCNEADCNLSHSLAGDHNQRVRAALGLAAANSDEDENVIWATDKDLIELLRSKMSLKPGVYPTEQSEPFHSVASDDSPGVSEPCDQASVCSGADQSVSSAASDDSPGVGISPSECSDQASACSDADQSVPAACQQYGTTTGCFDANCTGVHICPHFLANACRQRRNRPCALEHRLGSVRNREVLRQAGRLVTDENHQELVTMLYCSSPHVRRTEVYEKLRLCIPHSANGCVASECMAIHICHRFVVGSCKKTKRCPRGHAIKETDNTQLWALGLEDASADEVLEMLRAIHGGPSVSPDAVDMNECARASEDYVAIEEQLNPAISPAMNAILPGPGGTSTAKAASIASVSAAVDVTVPAVCRQYSSIQGCSDADCDAVHICPHFLAASCRRSNCSLGHRLTTAHNREALSHHGGRKVYRRNHDAIVKMLYGTSPHIRRTELYEKLRLCSQHGFTDGCKLSSCLNIHLCHGYLAGVCELETCDKGHRLEIPCNKTKLLANGLEDATAEEVLEMLRAVHGCRSFYRVRR